MDRQLKKVENHFSSKNWTFTYAKKEEGNDVVHRTEEESESGAKSVSYQDGQTDWPHADHGQESLLKSTGIYPIKFFKKTKLVINVLTVHYLISEK